MPFCRLATLIRSSYLLSLLALTTWAADEKPATPPPAAPVRTPAPTRQPDGPGAPKFTVAGSKTEGAGWHAAPGAVPPVDAEGDFVIGPDYLPAPELTVVAGVPQGTVRQFVMDSADSKYYSGIAREGRPQPDPQNPRILIIQTHPAPYQRTITVYVPQQYVPGTPAPFIVAHDGPPLGKPDLSLPHILDNLIAQHRVPVMIAVMIANGGGDGQGSERGLEYDTVSGKYTEFIEHEVLPLVEQNYGVTLTRDPNARAAMGGSSGAAAAFTMAWFHPEWYRRVLSYSGTFVNQQWPHNPETPGGAWEYHAQLIPGNAPKPIRLWLHVSDRDNYNARDGMHDWVEANHRMAAVLKAKGYHYQYVFSLNSGHVDRAVRDQTLPSALEWLWRDYKP